MRSGATHYDAIVAQMLPAHIAEAMPDTLCKKLAQSHYENFTVGSIFLPRDLRRHFYNIYAYCRVCDDLADETGDPLLSLKLLDWWQEELHACYNGEPRHPVFVALKDTIDQFDLPVKPFEDLINAFVQDQQVTRYATFSDLLSYCERSANPVGRLVLYLLNYRDEERQRLSDYTCTALQLANFWQDVAVDYQKGRIYLPGEDMERFGYTEFELRNSVLNASFIRLMRFETERTREFFKQGAELQEMIIGPGAADVELFTNGGTALLDSLERGSFNIFRKRISVSKAKKLKLMAAWGLKHILRKRSREG